MTAITATQQFKAVAYLRWCLFRNGFRRKGGAGELIARFIVYPIFAGFILGPLVIATTAAYYAASTGHLLLLAPIFWSIFALRVVVSINVSQPGLSFDPESLIRFPLSFSRYFVVRIFLGLLSASTIISTLCLLGVAAGVTVAVPGLWVIAFATALLVAVADMFFIRMIFAWIDRWLATRRARELAVGFFIFVGLGIQYLNFTYNPGFGHGRADRARTAAKIAQGQHLYAVAEPVLRHLPPGLGASAIASGAAGHALLNLLAIFCFGAVWAGIFAWRMQREYRGENLSEANNSPVVQVDRVVVRPAVVQTASAATAPAPAFGVPPTVAAVLAKEWIYLRRNTAQFYGLLAPLAMVFLFTLRMGGRMGHSSWLFPAAVAYSALGIGALAYNSLGLDATGVQFYFLAPVRFGDILLAKNIFGFAVNLVEILVIYGLISYTAGPPPMLTVLATACWLLFAAFVNAMFGNRRSLTAPKKMDPGKVSRRQASQLSALMSVGILLGTIAVGAMLLAVAAFFNMAWLPLPVLAGLAVGAFALYWRSLGSIDRVALNNRETMIEELCKAS